MFLTYPPPFPPFHEPRHYLQGGRVTSDHFANPSASRIVVRPVSPLLYFSGRLPLFPFYESAPIFLDANKARVRATRYPHWVRQSPDSPLQVFRLPPPLSPFSHHPALLSSFLSIMLGAAEGPNPSWYKHPTMVVLILYSFAG